MGKLPDIESMKMFEFLAEMVRPSVLYLPVENSDELDYLLKKRLRLSQILTRTMPNARCVLRLNVDQLRRGEFKFEAVPNGERVIGDMDQPVAKGAIVSAHITDQGVTFITKLIDQHIPITTDHAGVKEILKVIYQYYKPKQVDAEQFSTNNPVLKKFAALTDIEKRQLLYRLTGMVSWIEGWQVEDGNYKHYNRLFALLQKVVPRSFGNHLSKIYRSAYIKTDLSGQIGANKLITSSNQFQSWTTKPTLAMGIAKRNMLSVGSPYRPYLTIFEADIQRLDWITTIRDMLDFCHALRSAKLISLGMNSEQLWHIINSVIDKLEEAEWQDEVIIRSPVNRKIVARVVKVKKPE